MKKVLAVLVMAMAMPLAAWANDVAPPPCPTGPTDNSLADYIELGSCTVGDKVFSDFAYFGGAGIYDLDASDITVHPDNSDPLNPGLRFQGSWTAPGGSTVESSIEFTVSTLSHEPLIEDASLSILDSNVTGYGIVTVSEALCLGGLFSSEGQCSSGVTDSLLVGTAIGQNFDHTTFDSAVSVVDVVKDIGLTAPCADRQVTCTTSFAFVSDVTNNFSQVPEPATLTLLGTGLLAIGEKLRRRMKEQKKSS